MDASLTLPAPVLVASDSELAACCAISSRAQRIAFDTEFIRTDTFYPKLGLIQLCDGETVWLVDPLPITDFEPLLSLLRNPLVIKVFHSCSEDLEVLQSTFSALPVPLFDTQVAAAFGGYGFSRGYARLVEEVLGLGLDKHETRSDWLHRPLTAAQCLYAAEDVYYLTKVYDHLYEAIPAERLGWIADDMAALLDSAAEEDDLDSYYLRIKNGWKLSREDQFLVSRLAVWRERLAREENRPRGWIVPDGVLVEAVRLRASNRNQLLQIEGFAPRLVRQYGDVLLAMIDELGQQPVPGDFMLIQPPLERDARKVLSGLRGVIDAKAEALGLVPEVLARKRDLEALVRSTLDGQPVLPPALAHGWRHPAIGQELLAHVS